MSSTAAGKLPGDGEAVVAGVRLPAGRPADVLASLGWGGAANYVDSAAPLTAVLLLPGQRRPGPGLNPRVGRRAGRGGPLVVLVGLGRRGLTVPAP